MGVIADSPMERMNWDSNHYKTTCIKPKSVNSGKIAIFALMVTDVSTDTVYLTTKVYFNREQKNIYRELIRVFLSID